MWANIGVPSSDVPAEVDLLHMRIESHVNRVLLSSQRQAIVTPNVGLWVTIVTLIQRPYVHCVSSISVQKFCMRLYIVEIMFFNVKFGLSSILDAKMQSLCGGLTEWPIYSE